MRPGKSALFAAAALALASEACAQTVVGAFQVGQNPTAIAIDPVRNRLYVSSGEGLRVIDRNLGGATTTTSGLTSPQSMAVNIETDTVYVSNSHPASWVSIFDGTTRSLVANTPQIGYGPLIADTINNRVYHARSDIGAINVIAGRAYLTTSSTRSPYASEALAINPTNHRLYSLPYARDVVAMDMASPAPYVPVLCPDGSGGFRAQPAIPPAGTPESYTPCIDAWGTRAAINPVTNRIYVSYSSGLRVINGVDHSVTSVPFSLGDDTVAEVAVNPVTNKVYAFARSNIVVMDGGTNAFVKVPLAGAASGGSVAINVLTNTVYAMASSGDSNSAQLIVLDGGTNTFTTLNVGRSIGLVVDPLSNTVYALRQWSDETDSRGSIVVIAGAAGTGSSVGIQTNITPLAGNSTASASGSFTLNASSSMSPAPLGSVRKVYYRIDPFGPWLEASGSGPYTASFSGLARRAHTIQAFATNGLEGPLGASGRYDGYTSQHVPHVPVVGNIASYTFTVTDPSALPPPDLAVTQSATPNPQFPGNVSFHIVATNYGPGAAAGVQVTDTLPAAWTFVSASSCTHASGTVTCSVGTLAQGASAAFDVVAQPPSPGMGTNSVTVSGTYPDESMTNNSSSLDVTVAPPPPNLEGVVQISSGLRHACAVTSTGGVACWGDNRTGQLGDNTTTSRTLAAIVPALASGVAAVSAGGAYEPSSINHRSHTCALTNAGGVKCWGANDSGQLGDGSTIQRLTPGDVFGLTSGVVAISAGGRHTCALTSTGGVKCWGSNGAGELGDGTTTQRPTPVDVSGLSSGVVQISATDQHTCAVTSGGAAFCWGDNASGQLGDGTTTSRSTPVAVSSLSSGVATISTGRGAGATADTPTPRGSTCAVMTWGGAKCWGENASSQLGDGSSTDRPTPFDVYGMTSGAAAVAIGDTIYRACSLNVPAQNASHSCALMTNGAVKCWGVNTVDQLGLPGIGGSCYGANRRSEPVDTFLTSGITQISAGSGFNCALAATGGVTCWGGGISSGDFLSTGSFSRSSVQRTDSGRVPQSITFGPAPTIPEGGSGTVTATGGGSTNPVVFTSLTPSACSVSGSTVSGLSHAVCTIAANQAGNAGYDPAPEATQSFPIGGAAPQTITFGPAPSLVVGGTGRVSATSTSGNPVTFSSNTPSICSVSGDLVSGLAAGMCTIAANAAGNSLYEPAPQTTQNITVAPAGSSLANLSVSQTRSPNPAAAGKDVMFTMTVANAGPAATGSVTLQDVLQSDAAFVWASAACSHASGTVTCNFGSLASGASVQAKVVVRPSVAGSLTHTVSVSGSTTESDTTNNTSSITTTVSSTPVAAQVLRYRLYSDVTREHHFTTDFNEYTVLGGNGNWVQEGTVGKVLDNPGSFNGVAAVPYYRLYDTATRWHHWTADANEYYTLIEFPNWNAEGVDGYILPTQATGSIPLYRLLYPFIAGLHHWTIDANEYNTLIGTYGWIGEGGSGFVIP
jgi:uncharacterized repeat protein (TIGR01451 family)